MTIPSSMGVSLLVDDRPEQTNLSDIRQQLTSEKSAVLELLQQEHFIHVLSDSDPVF